MAVVHFTKESFEQEIVNGKKDALVDFWASWCVPCQMQSPILDEVEAEAADTLVGKINVDEESELAAMFNVMSIPTLIIFRDGKEHQRVSGMHSKQALLDMLK